MNSQIKLTTADFKSEKTLLTALRQIQRKMANVGHDPSWELYSNTFGWFQTSKILTEEDQQKVERVWAIAYEQEIQPIIDKHGEKMYKTMLDLAVTYPG